MNKIVILIITSLAIYAESPTEPFYDGVCGLKWGTKYEDAQRILPRYMGVIVGDSGKAIMVEMGVTLVFKENILRKAIFGEFLQGQYNYLLTSSYKKIETFKITSKLSLGMEYNEVNELFGGKLNEYSFKRMIDSHDIETSFNWNHYDGNKKKLSQFIVSYLGELGDNKPQVKIEK